MCQLHKRKLFTLVKSTLYIRMCMHVLCMYEYSFIHSFILETNIATLPVKAGGLGIRRVTLLSLPPFWLRLQVLAVSNPPCLQIPDDEQYTALPNRSSTY